MRVVHKYFSEKYTMLTKFCFSEFIHNFSVDMPMAFC